MEQAPCPYLSALCAQNKRGAVEAVLTLREECAEWASRNYSVRSDVGSLPRETLVAHHALWIGYRKDDNDPAIGPVTAHLTELMPAAMLYTADDRFVRAVNLSSVTRRSPVLIEKEKK